MAGDGVSEREHDGSDDDMTIIDLKMERAVRKFSQAHARAVDKLTKKQVAEVIEQILKSGDIARYLDSGGYQQTVVYIPFQREQQLKARIQVLETCLKEHGVELPE